MKLLVTGVKGQLGHDIVNECKKRNIEAVGVDVEEMDITDAKKVEEVIKEEEFKRGVERLKNGCEKGYKIILLGAMQDPIRCHRSILVGRELVKNDFDVKHILDDYSIVTQDDIEEMLLNKYFSNRNQITIEDLTGNSLNNEEMINEGYKLANREIGYRIENLK